MLGLCGMLEFKLCCEITGHTYCNWLRFARVLKMPKGKGPGSKKTQPECDLCGETICPTSQDSLQCEVCQSYMHRYCAGMTRSHYHELCSKSTPFVCMVCTQRSQRVIIQQLQNEVTALRSELVKLREAGSLETSATPEINKAALDALKDDVQQLKSSIHGYSTQSKQAKPSYARMAATTNSRKPPHKPAKGPHSAGEFPSITAKVKVTGARKIWGTMRESTVRSVKGVISKLCKIKPGFKVKRKDQPGDSFHKPKWWFVIHADESDLAKLDSGWGFQTTLPGRFSSVTNLPIHLMPLCLTPMSQSFKIIKHHKRIQHL